MAQRLEDLRQHQAGQVRYIRGNQHQLVGT
jgi:hypothetical protein